MKSKNFLFLQGPHGPFFKLLGKMLYGMGYGVYKINLNGGDFIDWPFFNSFSYKHHPSMWPDWIKNFATQHKITDVLLYGDCRQFHKAAINELRRIGVKIHVFEEGYIRPNWVTYEFGGVNAHSQVRRDVENIVIDKRYSKPADHLPAIEIKSQTKYLLRYTLRYYLFKWLVVWLYPFYRSHRPVNSLHEALLWVRRLIKIKLSKDKVAAYSRTLVAHKHKYYLFLMQLSSDFQIREHSSFKSMEQALMTVIYSFISKARKDTILVLKNHPFDNGQNNYAKLIKRVAKEFSIEDRLIFLDGGNLPELLDDSLAVITVNSTAGLQAIHHGKPLKILGNAIYDHPTMVNQCDLDSFWNNYHTPDMQSYKRFRNYLLKNNQINGSFYTTKGIKLLLKELRQKIYIQ